jgi:cold shock CspA family protein
MQATVHRFDPATSTGSVVTDDGLVLAFGAGAFATSRLRHLRVGQRLTVTVTADGSGQAVTALSLGTVGAAPGPASRP